MMKWACRLQILGGLRTGERRLFVYVHNSNKSQTPVIAQCILDFYVSEESQRLGVGKALFQVFSKSLDGDFSFQATQTRLHSQAHNRE